MKQTKQSKAILKIIVVVIILSTTFGLKYVYGLTAPVNIDSTATAIIIVKPDMTTKDIGIALYQNGVIRDARLFQAVAKIKGVENSLQAGEYAFTTRLSLYDIIDMLSKGKTIYRHLTVPEGYSIEQTARLIEEQGFGSANAFRLLAQKYAPYPYMERKSEIVYPSEGYIFPDTYQITKEMTEEAILQMMLANFDKRLTPDMRERAKKMGLSLHQLVTLASLVEKEAKVDKERAIIAGVFLNRLKQEMPLQSCPTVQYVLGYPKADLSIEDTQIASPYNTYQNAGLPPGPIASPGMAALTAVLSATDTNYLYFVANSDGTHRFSKTYDEHLAAIREIDSK